MFDVIIKSQTLNHAYGMTHKVKGFFIQVGSIPKARKVQNVFEICSGRYEKLKKKYRNTKKVSFVLGKRLRYSVPEQMEALFPGTPLSW